MSFRAMLREARERVLSDAEGFDEAIVAIEALGAYLAHNAGIGLGAYIPALLDLAMKTPLVDDEGEAKGLLEALRLARNDLMHEGATARRTAQQAVAVSLILEDAAAIEGGLMRVEHFMVEGPTCAEPWQTLKLIRRTMLAHQYSFLPVRMSTCEPWRLLSDLELARCIPRTPGAERTRALRRTLAEARAADPPLVLHLAHTVPIGTFIEELELTGHLPILVVSREEQSLRGIITAFDLL